MQSVQGGDLQCTGWSAGGNRPVVTETACSGAIQTCLMSQELALVATSACD